VCSCSLSLSHSQLGGAGHRPNPFQVAPEALRIGCEGVSWPGVPPGMIMGRTLEHQMLDRLVGAMAVRADGRVPAPDTVKVSRHQWGVTSAYLCHRHALVPEQIPSQSRAAARPHNLKVVCNCSTTWEMAKSPGWNEMRDYN